MRPAPSSSRPARQALKFTGSRCSRLWAGCRLSECLAADWGDFDGESLRVVGKGKRERIVPILPAAREAMGERRDRGRIFRRFHPNTVSHRFSRIALSVGGKKTLHGLRHSAATYMLKSGIPLSVARKVLGHADIRTTQVYAKVCDDLVRAEMTRLRYADEGRDAG
ncbi:MAG: tyrosine-type recombinase/integrase [Desulfobacterales bacterium]